MTQGYFFSLQIKHPKKGGICIQYLWVYISFFNIIVSEIAQVQPIWIKKHKNRWKDVTSGHILPIILNLIYSQTMSGPFLHMSKLWPKVFRCSAGFMLMLIVLIEV